MAEGIIQSIVGSAKALGVDGVDLVQREGCGVRNLRCDDQTSVHLHLIEGCFFFQQFYIYLQPQCAGNDTTFKISSTLSLPNKLFMDSAFRAREFFKTDVDKEYESLFLWYT